MKQSILILGDIVAILTTTFIGFATHREADLAFLPRMAAAFLPLVTAWFLLASFFGLFQQEISSNPKQLWRPVLAMIFAGPLAAVLRGLLLNAPVIPIFAVVLSATSALGMLLWRGLFLLVNRKPQ